MKALVSASLLMLVSLGCSPGASPARIPSANKPLPEKPDPTKPAPSRPDPSKPDTGTGDSSPSDSDPNTPEPNTPDPETPKNPDETSDQPMPEILPALEIQKKQTIKVLSLNVWTGGPDGLAKDIKTAAADIACLQEVDPSEADGALKKMGGNWSLVHTSDKNMGYAIVSRYPLVKRIGETASRGGIGGIFQINPGVRIAMFCHHGNYTPYGPYQLGIDKMSVPQVIQSEKDHRGWQMEELLGMVRPLLGGVDSVFLAGDFNAPSHVDYNPAVAWPISSAIHVEGFVDSWFEKHPDKPKKSACKFAQNDPGITWARLAEKEPNRCFDRIDFIYYSSLALKNVESKTIELSVSDHRSVLSTFDVTDSASGSKVSRPGPKNSMQNVDRRPLLSWGKTEKAAKYTVYLDKNSELSGTGVDVKTNVYQAPLLDPNTVYSWRVDVTDTRGKVTKGDVWTFKTTSGVGLRLAKTTFSPAERFSVEFDGGQATADWIGITMNADFGTSSWKYLNDSETKPSATVSKGKVTLIAPNVPGTYSVRGMKKDGYRDTDGVTIVVK